MEEELRRRALESMLKKKMEKRPDSAKEDGEVEDGEVDADPVAATQTSVDKQPSAKKSKWTDDEEEEASHGAALPGADSFLLCS